MNLYEALILLLSTAFAIAVGIWVPRWRGYVQSRAMKKQHGCKDLPIYTGPDINQARVEAMKEGKFFHMYANQFQKYGKTFQEIWQDKPVINTMEPANMQQVAALGFEDYGKDPARSMATRPFFGPSVFSDGLAGKMGRMMVKPIFARAELSDSDRFASFVDRFFELLPNDGSMVDVQPLLRYLFMDVSMDFIFGRSLGFLNREPSDEATDFLQAFLKAQSFAVKRRETGSWRSKFFNRKEDADFKEAYTTVHRYVDAQVARALEETKVNDAPNYSSSDGDDSTSRKRYILLYEMAKQIRDPIALRYQLLGVFLPGRESTGVALSSVLFQLARHPHVWQQLRHDALSLGDLPLTFERLKSLTYFRYVFHETIRTVGPAARIWRMSIKDTILPVGGGPDGKSSVFVPKDTVVVSVVWAMNHDRDIWGDDVEEFKPERWKDRKPLFEFLPFWAGPRICPAQQQVLTHVVYLLVRLTQKYASIENCDPVQEYLQKMTSSMESMNGVKVAFKNP